MLYVCNMVRHPLKNKFSIIRILFFMLSNFELYNNYYSDLSAVTRSDYAQRGAASVAGANERRTWRHISSHTHIYTHHPYVHTHTHAYVWGNAVGARADNAELVRVHIRRRTQGRWPWDTTSIGPGECLYNNIILSDVCTDNNNKMYPTAVTTKTFFG